MAGFGVTTEGTAAGLGQRDDPKRLARRLVEPKWEGTHSGKFTLLLERRRSKRGRRTFFPRESRSKLRVDRCAYDSQDIGGAQSHRGVHEIRILARSQKNDLGGKPMRLASRAAVKPSKIPSVATVAVATAR